MKVFLAGVESRSWILYLTVSGSAKDASIPCGRLAVEKWGGYDKSVTELRPYILESFYYADSDTERLIPYFGDFLLDSGAFTFMQNAGTTVNWDEYAHKYAAFIVKNNVKKYIELDLDYIIGCDGARRLRSILEEETGRKGRDK